MQSEYSANASEMEMMERQLKQQDHFDIKHLIANIPKPKRRRAEERSGGISSDGSSSEGKFDGSGKKGKKKGGDNKIGGMVITN